LAGPGWVLLPGNQHGVVYLGSSERATFSSLSNYFHNVRLGNIIISNTIQREYQQLQASRGRADRTRRVVDRIRKSLMTTPVSSILLVLFAGLIGSIGAVLLKAGANRLKEPWPHWFGKLLGGVILFGTSSIFYVWSLKSGSLTVLYPMISLVYVWVALWSKMFFSEPLNRYKVIGLTLIVLGVFSIAIGNS